MNTHILLLAVIDLVLGVAAIWAVYRSVYWMKKYDKAERLINRIYWNTNEPHTDAWTAEFLEVEPGRKH